MQSTSAANNNATETRRDFFHEEQTADERFRDIQSRTKARRLAEETEMQSSDRSLNIEGITLSHVEPVRIHNAMTVKEVTELAREKGLGETPAAHGGSNEGKPKRATSPQPEQGKRDGVDPKETQSTRQAGKINVATAPEDEVSSSWSDLFKGTTAEDKRRVLQSKARARRLAEERELQSSVRSLNKEGIDVSTITLKHSVLTFKDASELAMAHERGLGSSKSGGDGEDRHERPCVSATAPAKVRADDAASRMLDDMNETTSSPLTLTTTMTPKEAEERYRAKMAKPGRGGAEPEKRAGGGAASASKSAKERPQPHNYEQPKPVPENAQKLPRMQKKLIRLNSVV